MDWLARFISVTLTYSAGLSLVTNPGIGAMMTGACFALMFCFVLSCVTTLVDDGPVTSVLIANAIFAVVVGGIQANSAAAVQFYSYTLSGPTWIDGQPTSLGVLGTMVVAAFCIACNSIGTAIYHGLGRQCAKVSRL